MTVVLSLAIGLGLAVSLLFAELFGIAAGGMVVPGYFAIRMTSPLDVLMTLLTAFMTYFLVKMISPFIILYGRRRTALMILVGYFLGLGWRMVAPDLFVFWKNDFDIIGYIIPGLLAIWLDRQGVLETVSTLLIVSVIVRLLLIIFVGEDLLV